MLYVDTFGGMGCGSCCFCSASQSQVHNLTKRASEQVRWYLVASICICISRFVLEYVYESIEHMSMSIWFRDTANANSNSDATQHVHYGILSDTNFRVAATAAASLAPERKNPRCICICMPLLLLLLPLLLLLMRFVAR